MRIRALALGIGLAFASTAGAEQTGKLVDHYDGVAPEAITPATPAARGYSPYAGRKYPTRPLFGDTHHHTSNSGDAFMAGNRLSPEEAYRFALGEEVVSSTGVPAKLSRPLDFLVISDHAEGLGLMFQVYEGNPAFITYFSKMSIFSQKTITGMNGIDPMLFGIVYNTFNIQELGYIVAKAFRKVYDLVCLFQVPGIWLFSCFYNKGPDTHLSGSADNADGYFAPVGYQYTLNLHL